MLVQDVMTEGVLTARESDSLRSTVTKMITRHCGSIPVVDDNGELIGVVTLRDVLLPLYPSHGDYIHDNVHSRDFIEMEEGFPQVLEMQVKEVMTPNPFTVSPDIPVLKAASYMGLKNLRHIPVTEGRKLRGIVTINDINQSLFFKQD